MKRAMEQSRRMWKKERTAKTKNDGEQKKKGENGQEKGSLSNPPPPPPPLSPSSTPNPLPYILRQEINLFSSTPPR